MASFEEQLAELESVVARLEEGGLPLDESVSLFERGMLLSKACKKQLASAESRIQAVMEPDEDGPVRVEDVEVEVDEDGDEEDDEGEVFDDERDEEDDGRL